MYVVASHDRSEEEEGEVGMSSSRLGSLNKRSQLAFLDLDPAKLCTCRTYLALLRKLPAGQRYLK